MAPTTTSIVRDQCKERLMEYLGLLLGFINQFEELTSYLNAGTLCVTA